MFKLQLNMNEKNPPLGLMVTPYVYIAEAQRGPATCLDNTAKWTRHGTGTDSLESQLSAPSYHLCVPWAQPTPHFLFTFPAPKIVPQERTGLETSTIGWWR